MNIIDETDRKLLHQLQLDGRITNQELAQRVGLSPAGCLERVKRLRERKIIRRFTVEIDPKAVDLALLIFVEVSLDKTTDRSLADFAAIVNQTPEILECHMVAGGFDYLLKARVKDMEAYRAFLGDRLFSLPGLKETRTYAVLEEVKTSSLLPVK
jgi:Lrp/AsnC family leucine-responsive transcriptional regulator